MSTDSNLNEMHRPQTQTLRRVAGVSLTSLTSLASGSPRRALSSTLFALALVLSSQCAHAGANEIDAAILRSDFDAAYKEAVKIRAKGDKEGSVAIYGLALFGKAGPKVEEQVALDALTKAARAGSGRADWWLGEYYESRDPKAAYRHFSASSSHGYLYGTLEYARFCRDGIAFDKAPGVAYLKYKEAAAQGSASAYLAMADIRVKGLDGTSDVISAWAFASRALELNGLEPGQVKYAQGLVQILARQLTMSQSADAREVLQAIEAKGPNAALDTRLKQVDRDDNAAGRGNAGSQSSTVDAKSRLPLCMPDTAPGVDCVGPKDR